MFVLSFQIKCIYYLSLIILFISLHNSTIIPKTWLLARQVNEQYNIYFKLYTIVKYKTNMVCYLK